MDLELSNSPSRSKIKAYAILIMLSMGSALLILSLWIPLFTGVFGGGLTALIPFFAILITQYLLAAVATGLVIFLQRNFLDSSKINKTALIAVPLIFNLLAANSYVIYGLSTTIWRESQQFSVLHNHNLTIKEESIIAPTSIKPNALSEYHYHAILYLKNNAGVPIRRLGYHLVTFGDHDLKNINPARNDTSQNTIESGDWEAPSSYPADVEIEVNIPLYSTNYTPLICGDKRLDKKLYISYQVDYYFSDFQTIEVGDEIRQQLKKVVCSNSFHPAKNIRLTLKDETIAKDEVFTGYLYHATLHVENHSGIPIEGIPLMIGDYSKDNLERFFGSGEYKKIASGNGLLNKPTNFTNVDVDIDIQISFGEIEQRPCVDGTTRKWYFLYSISKQYYPILLGDNVSEKLQQITCAYKKP